MGKGYFAVSSGNVTDDVIAEYIKNQDEIERRAKNDNFTVGFYSVTIFLGFVDSQVSANMLLVV